MTARMVRNETWDRLKTVTDVMGLVLAADAKRDLDQKMRREVLDPLVPVVKGGANDKQSALAASTVQATTKRNKPGIAAGGRGTNGALFYGSEFGGGNSRMGRTKTYMTHNKGRWYKVHNRHTTRQFRPYRGKKGYWFTPTILYNTEWAMGRMADIIETTIEREL